MGEGEKGRRGEEERESTICLVDSSRPPQEHAPGIMLMLLFYSMNKVRKEEEVEVE